MFYYRYMNEPHPITKTIAFIPEIHNFDINSFALVSRLDQRSIEHFDFKKDKCYKFYP